MLKKTEELTIQRYRINCKQDTKRRQRKHKSNTEMIARKIY